MLHIFILFLCELFYKDVVCNDITLGAIFEKGGDLESAFEFTLARLNKESSFNITFTHKIKLIEFDDIYESSLATCSLIESGALGIFGPITPRNIEGAQSDCDSKEIPHILIDPIPLSVSEGTSISLHPDPNSLALAYIDIIEAWKWSNFILLYEDDHSVSRVSELLNYAQKKGMYFAVRQLYQIHDDLFRNQLKEIRGSGIHNFVIDCTYDYLEEVLHQAQQVGLITGKYSYLITNLDFHALDLVNYSYSTVNMTGIRLVDPTSSLVQKVGNEYYGELEWKFKTDVALLIDAIDLYSAALNKFDLTALSNLQDLNCTDGSSWKYGLTALNFMKTGSHSGLTGNIFFDHKGLRTDFELEVIELMEEGIVKVGVWNSTNTQRLEITHSRNKPITDDVHSLRNKTFRVSICLTEPYAMWKESPDHLQGNDQFEGYAIELIERLAEMEGFKHIFLARPDTDNGGKNATGGWTGLVGDIVYGRAELAIADLTITSERQEAVDFTEPFMNLGITILFEKPKKEPPSFFSFAAPFSFDTWAALMVSVATVSFSLYVLARLSPDEWINPYPCIEEPEYLINEFHLKNSFWFTIGSLMQQGTELEPRGTTVRMVGGFWWFFVLIIVASYTANLAAFLTTENPIELFKSLEGLVENAEKFGISYGCKAGGATYKFFKGAQNPLYQKVYEYLSEHPENCPDNNNAGVERAEKGKYAFFMETTSIDYAIQRHCDLDKVGNAMDDNKGYGIALLKDSPYRNRLTLAILELQSSGYLEELRKRWWEERRGGGQCGSDDDQEADAQPLYLMHVEGVFYVTIYGTILAFIMSIIEWLIGVMRVQKRRQISFREALISELHFFLSFENSKSNDSDSSSGSKGSKSLSKSKSKSRILNES